MWKEELYAEDRRRLHELAVYCYRVAVPLLEKLPKTRLSQEKLVGVLGPAIAAAGTDFEISKEFLIREVMLRDKELLDPWCGSPEQLAWLMVHEELSAFFTRYAVQHWDSEVFLVHHLPKSAGTSVNELLDQQHCFVSYPQATFDVMCASYGLLGFSAQLEMFNGTYRNDRIYVGGHYNLPDTVRDLGVFGRCQGVTLCRPPVVIMSSAVRHIWTMIEDGGVAVAELYQVEGADGAELQRLRERFQTTDHVDGRVTDLLMAIMSSRQFRAEFDEIFVRYFYNDEIDSVGLLSEYLVDCGAIFPSLDLPSDPASVLEHLKVDGILPRANTSIFSEKHLLDAVGGAEAFAAIVGPRLIESSRIYLALTNLRNTFGRKT